MLVVGIKQAISVLPPPKAPLLGLPSVAESLLWVDAPTEADRVVTGNPRRVKPSTGNEQHGVGTLGEVDHAREIGFGCRGGVTILRNEARNRHSDIFGLAEIR